MPARPGGPRLSRDVAPGVHRLEHAFVNSYLIVDGDAVTIVDTAFPATWDLLPRVLAAIGRRPGDVAAVVLTHAHFDHLGFAKRIREEWNVPVWAHPEEDYIAAHPYRYAHESPRMLYPFRYPGSVPVIGRMVKAGALLVPGIEDLRPLVPGTELDVPGRPEVVFTPGHTFGHCALHLPDRDALLTGDALVTFNPYTAGTGPQVVSAAATADLEQAFESLALLDAVDAGTVLPGHGEPWRSGVRAATVEARLAGPS
jgi:glyoxylase-like metal-dependent hydrolase (beta-lactamase superfamily II)